MSDLLPRLLGPSGQLGIRWQPVVDLAVRRPVAWQPLLVAEQQGAALDMAQVFSTAEDRGLLERLDAYAWESAVDGARSWLGQQLLVVKVDPGSLARAAAAFVGLVRARESGLAAEQVVLEVSVSSDASDVQLAGLAAGCRRAGFRLCLADVGTASVAARAAEYADVIKLTPDLLDFHREGGEERLHAVADVCAAVEAQMVAFGVETAAQAVRAQQAGVGWGQGWYFGRPVEKP